MSTLLRELKAFYSTEGRSHLPWRKTRDPYRILVSEIMLQQTQVDRVVPFFKRFIKIFPTASSLARAPLSKVLQEWQGLGYNRRAKFLHEAAKKLSTLKQFPRDVEDIQKLPGVGHYTARAVATFAFDAPEVFVETNIRTVFFHHFRELSSGTGDNELFLLVEEVLKKSKMAPREFYAALMDYGAYLKKQGIMLNEQSKHYTKQSAFKGSARQLRGALIRELLKKPATQKTLIKNLSRIRQLAEGEVARELMRLQTEGLVVVRGRYFSIAS